MYAVKIMETDGSAPRFSCEARRDAYRPNDLFTTFGAANRHAIDKASIEPGHVTYVVNFENMNYVLVSYVSLSALRWGKIAMVDNGCSVELQALPAAAQETLAWFAREYAKEEEKTG